MVVIEHSPEITQALCNTNTIKCKYILSTAALCASGLRRPALLQYYIIIFINELIKAN